MCKGRRQLQKAIQDAMFAAVKIGFQFLWIDRYCVSQDEKITGEQVRNMD
jgi:hypothetical protein